MRIIIIGAGPIAAVAAKLLIERESEVVIIDEDEERLDALSHDLDSGFLRGHGSKPAVLREAGVGEGDFVFCLTDDDQTNILAALVGRSLGAERIVVKVEDGELEALCKELGLRDVIVPDRTTGQALADLVAGGLGEDPASVIKHHARFFSFTLREEEVPRLADLGLPKQSRIVCIYRNKKLILPDEDTELRKGDEVVLIADASRLEELAENWGQPPEEG